MKVDEKTDTNTRQAQISKNLSFMYRCKRCNGFQLDYYLLVDDQIGSISDFHPMAVVHNRERKLALEREITLLELDTEECVVGALEQPTAYAFADFNRASDN